MLEDTLLYTFIYGSCIYWSCFLLCELTFEKALAKAAIYTIAAVGYAGIALLYFMTSLHSLSFIEYIMGCLLFIIVPLLYKDSIAKMVFTYFSSLLFFLILHTLSNLLTNHTFIQISDMQVVSTLTPEMLFRFFTLSFVTIYVLLLSTVIKKQFQRMMAHASNESITAACCFPIAAFIILMINYINLAVDLSNFNHNVIALLTLILLILCAYFVLYFTLSKQAEPNSETAKRVKKERNEAMERVVNKLNPPIKKEVISDPVDLLTGGRSYYETLLNNYMDMNNRTQLLDHHMQTMNSLLLNDNVAGATVFIDRILKTFHDHDVLSICNNQPVNLLLSYYYYVCKQEQIFLETRVSLPGQLPIPDLELCILFGNCMKNAVEACGYLKDRNSRFIHLECGIQNGTLSIVMDNSFDGFINKVNNQLKSRKKFGGVGLKTVQAVVGKYKGTIDMEYPQNVFSISLKLPLNPKSTIHEKPSITNQGKKGDPKKGNTKKGNTKKKKK